MISWYFTGWIRLKPNDNLSFSGRTLVSVIIPVRNESDHIMACLESIAKQSYPRDLFEIILIDDFSSDNTKDIATRAGISNLHVFSLEEFTGELQEKASHKKRAIEWGTSMAVGGLIVTTDGDCITGKDWLRTIVAFYENNDFRLIAGPVKFFNANNFLEAFQEMDLMSMVGITGSSIRNGAPVMCNGANLIFEKSVFRDINGYEGVDHIPSGDDVFLMYKVHKKYPGSIGFLKDVRATVHTHPSENLTDFIEQRKRWVSKSSHFQSAVITATLSFAYLINLMIFSLMLMWLVQPQHFSVLFLTCLLIKSFADLTLLILICKFFNRMKLLYLFPLVQLSHWIYVIVIGIWGTFGDYEWKGRKVTNSILKT